MAVGLYVLGKPIMALIFPSLNADLAGPLLSTLGLATLFVCMMLVCNSILQAHGFVNLPVAIMLMGGVVKIFTNYHVVVVPSMGIYGAPMGNILCFALCMVLDLVVIALAALAFHSLSSALYGLVSLYISSLVIDRVLYGLDNAKVAYIISDRPQEIIRSISTELDRGVTILRGAGAWSGEAKDVLMCAFKQKQIVALKRAVKETDPSAFLIVCDAHEVLGQGFHSYHQHDL